MKLKALGFFALLGFMPIGNSALANHEVIVTPEPHSGSQSTRHDNRPADNRSRRHTRHDESSYRFSRPFVTPYFGAGVGSGGDVVGRFTDNFGDTDRVRSGGGFYVEGGLLAAFDFATFLRVTAGYETDRTDRRNGQASFDRTRFDLSLLRSFGVFELGAGLTAHAGVEYDCNIGSICSDGVEFDNAVGYTLEAALTSLNRWGNRGSRHPLRNARLGLRFTDIEYSPEFNLSESFDDDELDGTSLSFFIGFSL